MNKWTWRARTWSAIAIPACLSHATGTFLENLSGSDWVQSKTKRAGPLDWTGQFALNSLLPGGNRVPALAPSYFSAQKVFPYLPLKWFDFSPSACEFRVFFPLFCAFAHLVDQFSLFVQKCSVYRDRWWLAGRWWTLSEGGYVLSPVWPANVDREKTLKAYRENVQTYLYSRAALSDVARVSSLFAIYETLYGSRSDPNAFWRVIFPRGMKSVAILSLYEVICLYDYAWKMNLNVY